jgi:myo-inositol-1(or 4)-monophosphatase
VLGCAAVECAFVAAGLARIAYIPRPKIWDVAAGLVLLQAAGCVAVVRRASRWDTMLYLPQAAADIVGWSESLLIGHHVEIERAMRDVE